MKPKKWYKDKSRKEIAGVIAGLYDYFDLYENYGWKLENVRLVVILLAIITIVNWNKDRTEVPQEKYRNLAILFWGVF